jgi:hypothetical protein
MNAVVPKSSMRVLYDSGNTSHHEFLAIAQPAAGDALAADRE